MSVENVVTRYGPLGRLPALAAQLVISKAGSAAIIALNTAHLTLGLRPDRAANIPPSQTPADRWHQLMIWLFWELPDTGVAANRLPLPLTVTPAEERTVDKLLGAAGAFLLAESRALDNQINTWLAVEFGNDVPDRETDELSAMRARILVADKAGQELLRMVGKGNWQEALAPQVETTVDAATADLGDEAVPARVFSGGVMRRPARNSVLVWCSDLFDAAVVDTVYRALSKNFVVIVDFSGAVTDNAADRVAAWAETLKARDAPYGETVLWQLIVAAVDGRQTDPIALEYAPSTRLLDDCRGAIAAAILAIARPDRTDCRRLRVDHRPLLDHPSAGAESFSPPEPDATGVLERVEDLAAALAYTVDTVEPQHILVVSDLTTPDELEHDVTRFFAPSAELQEHFSRLRDSSLSFAETSVTVAPVAHPASPGLWRALCGDSSNLTLLSHLHDAPATTPSIGSAWRIRTAAARLHTRCELATHRSTTRESSCPQGRITILVNLEEKPPRRVLARASVAVLSLSLALALASTAAGFALAGTGPALPAAIGALVGLGSGAAGLLWARRTESVNALSSVATAAVRVLGPEQTKVTATEIPAAVSDYRDAAQLQRSLV